MPNLNQTYLEFKTHVEYLYFLIKFVVYVHQYVYGDFSKQ